MDKLAGKVAVVTGAARGLGAAIAARLCEEGAVVLLTDVLEARRRSHRHGAVTAGPSRVLQPDGRLRPSPSPHCNGYST